ncbi:uncharacterized protein FTJAE_5033 [Fusarium tjaetaba]|uniref:Uncharacterized protein n=1 Tax=Fusarium tjaetaba TaxID=1567544 RepID=A0A8H5RV31_9HYPO|nr:uncharacterized protein FTJAE_5033 [Fusarium tjaetaba]KAF5638962.1 hypothetical protein FTJAE_5033 [Fusarium tjaetaba]
MPPKRRASGRKRRRSPDACSPPRPTQAPRLHSEDPVVSPIPEADEPQGSRAGSGDEETACAKDDNHHKAQPSIKLSEKQLRLAAINEDIYQYLIALREAKDKLGVDSNVVKVLTKVYREACDHYKRVDAEKTPDVEVHDGQLEAQSLEQRVLALESHHFLLRGNVIPMIKKLERGMMALRAEMEGWRE